MKDIATTFAGFAQGKLASNALAEMGIASMEVTKGEPAIFAAGPEMVLPDGLKQFFEVNGSGTTSELILKFAQPVSSFSITRIGVINGASMPKWRMEAYDDNGRLVSTAGDGTFSFDMQPRGSQCLHRKAPT